MMNPRSTPPNASHLLGLIVSVSAMSVSAMGVSVMALALAACGAASSGDADTAADASTDTSVTTDASESGASSAESGESTQDSEAESGGACSTPGSFDADCPSAMPFCSDELACVNCSMLSDGSAACAQLDPALPVCFSGTCVECGAHSDCPASAPSCSPAQTCISCTWHDQCPNSACNLDTGACMDDSPVYWVDGDSGDDANEGTQASPFASIGHAVDQVADGANATLNVFGSIGSFEESVLISGKTVALLTPTSAHLFPQLGAAITVDNNGTAFVNGFGILGGAFDGVVCSSGKLWLDGNVVSGNAGDGVVVMAGCAAWVRNTMVFNHGFTGVDRREISNAGDLVLSYSTVVGQSDTAPALRCDQGSTEVRNSIVISASSTVMGCDTATYANNAMNNAVAASSGSNTDVGALNPDWFEAFFGGNFSLPADPTVTPFGGLALLGTGDLPFDLAGDPRPSNGYVGADEPSP